MLFNAFIHSIFYSEQRKCPTICFIMHLTHQSIFLTSLLCSWSRDLELAPAFISWEVWRCPGRVRHEAEPISYYNNKPIRAMGSFSLHVFGFTDVNKGKTCKVYKERLQARPGGIRVKELLSVSWIIREILITAMEKWPTSCRQSVCYREIIFHSLHCWLTGWIWHEVMSQGSAQPARQRCTSSLWIQTSRHIIPKAPTWYSPGSAFFTWEVEMEQV